MRYSLPLVVIATILAASLLVQVLAQARGRPARAAMLSAIGVVGLLSLGRGFELDLLLRHDSRYQAEAWMRAHLPQGARGEVYQKPTFLPRLAPRFNVQEVPIRERTIAGIRQRKPDFVVLSSASYKSISHTWNPDWRQTGTLLLSMPEAGEFVKALDAGQLDYQRVATFRQHPRLIRVRITGLCPEIVVYQRVSGEKVARALGDDASALSRR